MTGHIPDTPQQENFAPILEFIRAARGRALAAVNHELLDLYWRVGAYLSRKASDDGWGQGTVKRLATWLAEREPGIKGFSAQNLWRMKQLHETYRADEKLSALLRELPWTHNVLILSKPVGCAEERSASVACCRRDSRAMRFLLSAHPTALEAAVDGLREVLAMIEATEEEAA